MRNAKPCTWEVITPGTSTCSGLPSLKVAGQKRIWASFWTRTSNVPWLQGRIMVYWATLGKLCWIKGSFLSGLRSFLSFQVWWSCTCSAASNSGLSSTRETWSYWKESNEGPWRWWRTLRTSPVRRGWGGWNCAAGRRPRVFFYCSVQTHEGKLQRRWSQALFNNAHQQGRKQ